MLSVLILSLLIPVTHVADMPMAAFSQQGDPPVKLWLNKDRVELGDRVRVDVRTESDGYLLVIHAEPDGRVRVLFPLDPIHDNFVRGRSEFEIRGRGDREAFRVYSSEGVGTVYAAFSRDPFQFQEFVRGDHWDYSVRDAWYVVDDPEPEITDLVLGLASGAYFDYDFVQYGVGDAIVAAGRQYNLSLYSDPYYFDSFNVGIRVGGYYDPVWRYRSLWRVGYMGWPSYRYGCWHGSWSCYDPFYWNYYDPWYYGGYYGYGYGYGYPYRYTYAHYPTYRYRTTPVVYVNDRLRITTATRLQPSNGATRDRRVYAGTLGSSVRRTSATHVVSPTAGRLAANSVTGDRTPQRATATTSTGRRAVDSPRTAPAPRTGAPTAGVTTNDRRTVNPTADQPQRRTATEATAPRQATPTRATATTRRVTSTRQATAPRETPATTRRTTPTRAATSRPAAVRSTPSSAATSRPAAVRSTPSSATTSRPAAVRSTPSSATTSRPAAVRSTPSSATTSRPAVTRREPARTSGSSARPSTTSGTRKPVATSSSTSRRKP